MLGLELLEECFADEAGADHEEVEGFDFGHKESVVDHIDCFLFFVFGDDDGDV